MLVDADGFFGRWAAWLIYVVLNACSCQEQAALNQAPFYLSIYLSILNEMVLLVARAIDVGFGRCLNRCLCFLQLAACEDWFIAII